eukprot:1072255-Prymnesium_polylepis.2
MHGGLMWHTPHVAWATEIGSFDNRVIWAPSGSGWAGRNFCRINTCIRHPSRSRPHSKTPTKKFHAVITAALDGATHRHLADAIDHTQQNASTERQILTTVQRGRGLGPEGQRQRVRSEGQRARGRGLDQKGRGPGPQGQRVEDQTNSSHRRDIANHRHSAARFTWAAEHSSGLGPCSAIRFLRRVLPNCERSPHRDLAGNLKAELVV